MQAQTYINTEWETNYGLPDSIDWTASTLDHESNLYIVGNTVVSGQGPNILSSKYDSDGNLIWSKEYNYANDRDYGVAIAVDGNGNVYVTGASFDPASTSFDYVTIMYDAHGTQQWAARYDGDGSDLDIPVAIQVDGYGNIIVTGMSAGTNLDMDYATLCYDPGGTNLWTSRYNYAGGDDRAGGLEVAPTGEIVVVGISMDSTGNNQYAYLQYDESDGSTLIEERKNLPGIALEKPAAIAQDNYGNFYITGSVSDGTHYDMYTAKLDDSLQIDWEATYDGDSLNDEPNAIGVDTAANVFVTGYTEDDNGKQFVTIKYDPNGDDLWVRTESSGSGTGSAEATDLQITLDDKIYVTGSRSVGSTNSVYTVCYNQDGEKQWEQFTDEEEEAADVQADLYGNVFVTGRSFANGGYVYLALKYSSFYNPMEFITDSLGNLLYKEREAIVMFAPTAIQTSFVNNFKLSFGKPENVLTTAALTDFTNQFGNEEFTFIRIFDYLKTTDTVSISRLGEDVRIPPFWAAFRIIIPESMEEENNEIKKYCNELNDLFPIVVYAHPSYFGKSDGPGPMNDPDAGAQLSFEQIDLDAWCFTMGNSFVKVGIFDTGIDWTHDDFGYNGINLNTSKVVAGWEFFLDVELKSLTIFHQMDASGHGTQVAGIIGAQNNNFQWAGSIAGGNHNPAPTLNHNDGVSLYGLKIIGSAGGWDYGNSAKAVSISAMDTGATSMTYDYGSLVSGYKSQILS